MCWGCGGIFKISPFFVTSNSIFNISVGGLGAGHGLGGSGGYGGVNGNGTGGDTYGTGGYGGSGSSNSVSGGGGDGYGGGGGGAANSSGVPGGGGGGGSYSSIVPSTFSYSQTPTDGSVVINLYFPPIIVLDTIATNNNGIYTLKQNVTIPTGSTLTINNGITLVVPTNVTLTIQGTLTNSTC